MKIAFLTGSLQAGGLERFVTRVAVVAHQRKVFEPVIICLTNRTGIFLDVVEREGIHVYQAPAGWYRSPFGWFSLVRLIRRVGPDIVHSQVNFSMVQQFFATVLTGAKFTITERNCYERSGFALFRRRIQYRVMKWLGVLYSANSARVARHLATMLDEDENAFPVLPNGIETGSQYSFSSNDGTEAAPVTIAYVARMAAHKGHLFFLNVIEELAVKRGIVCAAILIGDGPLRGQIEKAVDDKGLRHFVRFTGIVSNVEEYIRSSDIVSLLSDFEGMPNVVIEAMAEGKPVVTTDIGNVRELLDSDAGITLPSKDLIQAVKSFETLIRKPVLRKKMGEAGRRRIEQSFSLTMALTKLLNYYDKLGRK